MSLTVSPLRFRGKSALEKIDALDDLHRLRLALEAIPDEAMRRRPERDRGRGRENRPGKMRSRVGAA